MSSPGAESLSARLLSHLHAAIAEQGGWLPFDRYMDIALYQPGLGYYSRGSGQIGLWPGSGSDFVTAPELSSLFGTALSRQVAQALDAAEADEVFEFGAGTGALAAQLLGALGPRVRRYSIVDLSGTLRARQAEELAPFGDRVRWLDEWPAAMQGVVLGNEVLDAMPVQLLHWDGRAWWERGVSLVADELAWADRATALRPPVDAHFVPGTVVEVRSDVVVINAGLKSEGIIPIEQFRSESGELEVAVGDVSIGPHGAAVAGQHDARAERLSQQPGSRHVVGVDVGFDQPFQRQAMGLDEVDNRV